MAMVTPLIVSVGMPRAGSGWHYNLIHDLVVAAGGKDSRWIRRRYLLQPILTEVNCNIGAFTAKRLLPVMVPALLGNSFVIKAHAGITPLANRLIRSERIRPTYIYRDPRDALLSAYEYGQRKRVKKRLGAFADLSTIERAISFMAEYIQISESWLDCNQALHTRYEELLLDYPTEIKRIMDFLNLDPDMDTIKQVIHKYQPQRGSTDQKGTHFVQGKIGRYQQQLSEAQQLLCIDAFGPYLKKMDYQIP